MSDPAGPDPTQDTLISTPSGQVSSADLSRRIVAAAVARGLITAAQGSLLFQEDDHSPSSIIDRMVDKGLIGRDTATSLEDEVRNDFVPGYRLITELGRGGMGVVYKALQKRLERPVALKVVQPSVADDQEYMARFRREALTLARLNHPSVVQVYDYGEAHGKMYIALEFVEGEDCSELLARQGPYPPLEAARIARDAAKGLQHALSEKIIHRDVKPANIMLTTPGPDNVRHVKVTDLGLARLTEGDAGITRDGFIMGSPAYMAPEQIRGEDADFRVDLYALGATLYELLTHHVPYEDRNIERLLLRKQSEALPDPRTHAPDLPHGLIHVLDRLLARPPHARYDSYQDLIDDLDAVLLGNPPTSKPVDPADSSLALADRKPPSAILKPLPSDTTGQATINLPQTSAAVAAAAPAPPSSRLPLLLGLAALALAALAAALVLPPRLRPDPPTADAPDDPPPVATPAPTDSASSPAPPRPRDRLRGFTRALEALASLPPAQRLDQFEELTRLQSRLEEVPASLPLRIQLKRLANEALRGAWDDVDARLHDHWSRGDYQALHDLTQNLLMYHERFSVDPPAALREHAERAARGLQDDAGARDQRLWERVQHLDDPTQVLDALEGVAERAPFSPHLDDYRALRERALAQVARLSVTTNLSNAQIRLGQRDLGRGACSTWALRGTHTLTITADGHFPETRDLELRDDLQLEVTLGPQPSAPVEAITHQYFPVWNPGRPFLSQWTVLGGSWRSVPERSALVGEADQGWSLAERDLSQAQGRLHALDPPGWQLHWQMPVPSEPGVVALRLLPTPDGQWITAGADAQHLYLGTADDSSEQRRFLHPITAPPRELHLDVTDGVAVFYADSVRIGSLPVPADADPATLRVAVRGCTAEVRELTLNKLRVAR